MKTFSEYLDGVIPESKELDDRNKAIDLEGIVKSVLEKKGVTVKRLQPVSGWLKSNGVSKILSRLAERFRV